MASQLRCQLGQLDFFVLKILYHGFGIGLATGLGAASADSFYGFLAGGGLAIFSKMLFAYMSYITSIGGAALVYLGAKEIKNSARGAKQAANLKAKGFCKVAAATCLLTLSSPATIISYVAVFAALGSVSFESGGIFVMVFGVFCGSLIWWLMLAGVVSKLQHKISARAMFWVKNSSGIILISFGLYAIFRAFN